MKTKTHFAFRVDIWDDVGGSIVEHVAGVGDFEVAEATYRAVVAPGPARQRDHPLPMGVQEGATTSEQRTNTTLGECCKRRLDLTIAAGLNNDDFLSDRMGRGLHISSLSLAFRSVGVHEHRDPWS
jgi:hypothetical protein